MDSREQECIANGNANSTPMQDEFWPSTGPTSDDGETPEPFRLMMWPTPIASDHSPQGRGATQRRIENGRDVQLSSLVQHGPSTSSRAAFPAPISPTPESEPESKASNPDYGLSSPESFAYYDPAMSSWRTSQLCLDGEPEEFSETWPRCAIIVNMRAYRLRPLVRRISGIGSLSWPTPTSSANSDSPAERRRKSPALECIVKMYPAPQASDHKGINQFSPDSGSGHGPASVAESSGEKILPKSLNPAWVEWLMGFPEGWTEIDDTPQESPAESKTESTD